MAISRRKFFTMAGGVAATIVLASPLKKLYQRITSGQPFAGKGFGELKPDPRGLMDLPKGFQYRILSITGNRMSDKNPTPGALDGMAAFPGTDNTTILIRNHELLPSKTPAVIAPDDQKYDPLCSAGTTTLVVGSNSSDGGVHNQLVEEYASLAGTCRNCAGGATPWGSWISCEETIYTPKTNKPEGPNVAKKHGYNFEIPVQEGLFQVPVQNRLVAPVPLLAMGRFNHEAIAVDPKTGYVYQTEDRKDSSFYRFRPKEKGNLKAGGVLEALVIKGMPKVNTSKNFPQGEPKAVEWIKIDDVDPEEDTLRREAQEKGAAIFRRGEGICYHNGEIFFTCTDGGNAGKGQVFRYLPAQDQLELFVESPGEDILDYPDNLIMAPFGDLIMCEDGLFEQFLVGVTPQGEYYPFAHNALNFSELAGVCFSPDGRTMFVNIQTPGITLAIWGPWDRRG